MNRRNANTLAGRVAGKENEIPRDANTPGKTANPDPGGRASHPDGSRWNNLRRIARRRTADLRSTQTRRSAARHVQSALSWRITTVGRPSPARAPENRTWPWHRVGTARHTMNDRVHGRDALPQAPGCRPMDPDPTAPLSLEFTSNRQAIFLTTLPPERKSPEPDYIAGGFWAQADGAARPAGTIVQAPKIHAAQHSTRTRVTDNR